MQSICANGQLEENTEGQFSKGDQLAVQVIRMTLISESLDPIDFFTHSL